jgi:hypothetical protein
MYRLNEFLLHKELNNKTDERFQKERKIILSHYNSKWVVKNYWEFENANIKFKRNVIVELKN